MKSIIEKPSPPAAMDRFDRLACGLQTLLWQLQEETARCFRALDARLAALEAQAQALAPLADSDRLAVAKLCRGLGIPPALCLNRRFPRGSARLRAQVFRTLRRQGWSCDRIARAAGFTARGVSLCLARFASPLA